MTSGVVKIHNRCWHSHQETHIEVPSLLGYWDGLFTYSTGTGSSQAGVIQDDPEQS